MNSNNRRSRNTRRRNGGNPTPNARALVSNALRREHGFVARSAPHDPPPYKETIILNFKTRAHVTATGTGTVIVDVGDLIPINGEYKIVSLTVFGSRTADVLTARLRMARSVTDSSVPEYEYQSGTDYAGANHRPSLRFHPPKDDWFSNVSTAIRQVELLLPTDSDSFVVDVVCQAKVSIPVQEVALTPSADALPALADSLFKLRVNSLSVPSTV
jgi:hypothetical protein